MCDPLGLGGRLDRPLLPRRGIGRGLLVDACGSDRPVASGGCADVGRSPDGLAGLDGLGVCSGVWAGEDSRDVASEDEATLAISVAARTGDARISGVALIAG